MATFYNDNTPSAWKRFLQQKSFTEDITSTARSQTEAITRSAQQRTEAITGAISHQIESTRRNTSEITSAVDRQTDDITSATRSQTEAITGAIDHQIESAQRNALAITGAIGRMSGEISGAVQHAGEQVAGAIEDLRSAFDWRMSQVVGLMEIANILAIIPDFQKERRYYIEKGIEFNEKALRNPDFFADALENFLEAEEREKTDYAVLYRIGLVYLYQPKLLDLAKAEDYLLRAGKYASAEEDAKAIKAGAEAYFQAGIACYTQGKFAEAAELSQRAFILNPTLLEAEFNQAKFLAADDRANQALPILHGVIETDRMYAPKTAQDGDLATKSKVLSLLEQLRDDAVHKATEIVNRCKREMIPDSQAIPVLHEIEKLFGKNSYLDALTALDVLTKKRKWTLELYEYGKIVEQTIYMRIEEFVLLERESMDTLVREATERLERCQKEIIADSKAASLLLKIETIISNKTYINVSNALDELTEKKEWTLVS
ncbi:MAG: hypothetical protein P9M15_07550 [Candidatus Electryoneaceae bacterium]|nr:hypothetical protein [Candidatus Electryoneaceae bacterium]